MARALRISAMRLCSARSSYSLLSTFVSNQRTGRVKFYSQAVRREVCRMHRVRHQTAPEPGVFCVSANRETLVAIAER